MGKVKQKMLLALLWVAAIFILLPLTIYLPFGPWPSNTVISIYNSTGKNYAEFKNAMEGWNKVQKDVTFEFAHNPQEAKVIVTGFEDREEMAIHCSPGKKYSMLTVKKSMVACVDWQGYKPIGKIRLGVQSNAYISTQILSHELGHIMGLSHTDDHCSIMKSSLEMYGCLSKSPPQTNFVTSCLISGCDYEFQTYERCGPMPTDIVKINRIYKKNLKVRDIWCIENVINIPGIDVPVSNFIEKTYFNVPSAMLK